MDSGLQVALSTVCLAGQPEWLGPVTITVHWQHGVPDARVMPVVT